MVDLAAAYESCERTARGHYENFPVASFLVPAGMRRHVTAVYAFARAADDFADEGDRSPGQRLALLDGWRTRLHEAVVPGDGATVAARDGEPANTVEIFRALGDTIRTRALPVSLFDDLLSAFRQDVTVHRYDTWADLLDYCRRSANPVGRLVLRLANQADDVRDRWSDAICTALQLTNFWQDRGVDLARGRNYLPADVTMADALARTRALFEFGRPLCDAVSGRLRYELRATWLGGRRILDRVAAGSASPAPACVEDRPDTRPTLAARDVPWFAWRLLTWRAAR